MVDEQGGETEETGKSEARAAQLCRLASQQMWIGAGRSLLCPCRQPSPARLVCFHLLSTFVFFSLFRPVHVYPLDIIDIFSGLSWPLAASAARERHPVWLLPRRPDCSHARASARGLMVRCIYFSMIGPLLKS
jgi:hypothetical protein